MAARPFNAGIWWVARLISSCSLCLLCLLLVSGTTAAPLCLAGKATTLTGTVLDKTTGQPIPYASVVIATTDKQVQTNSSGKFSLQLGAGAENGSLRVSSVGYKSQAFAIADLVQQQRQGSLTLYLLPKQETLNEVEVKARNKKWKARKVGYHIDEGTTFHHELYPADTIPADRTGPEIGNRIILKKQPALVQSVSFGLTGSGVAKVEVGIKLYSLKDNLPHQNLLPESVVVAVPPHHTGWISVNLEKYNLTVQEDVVLVLEWLTETNKLSNNSLMGFSTMPKDQVTYYRETQQLPWQLLGSTLLSIRSYGMYVTFLYEK
ncbi:carboxypeptidase-like regulatory domain-containing protein [Pontibacter qinzhouensis]|uniref:Carboxypeptidase-like regulatory domain-containing protein n=1 Tax=Pontibacter qinzhouensis TaxID=2603253 RepID=A0A5C8JIQ5_9BACT|nr:carboxypeptidase-like regulatory domain-containing protein [Pontibacter qinzhouensis]TXK36886.1 carboxypeptidase-like regulatory domain-containing protein [Pontibacter qinzhouensis]